MTRPGWPPSTCWRAVRDRGAYANLALGPILRDAGLHGRDAALATELAYGILPHASASSMP